MGTLDVPVLLGDTFGGRTMSIVIALALLLAFVRFFHPDLHDERGHPRD